MSNAPTSTEAGGHAGPVPLAQGTSAFGSPDAAFPVYDTFWELGGRRFDTAWIYGYSYGPGCCERVFGDWVTTRGVASSAWTIVKGAHTPECRPDAIQTQLQESLERLKLDGAPMYMLHRDDPEVPVGEFVGAIQDLIEAGLVHSYGFSNWSLARVEAAIQWAIGNGLTVPTGLSNQFSLTRMIGSPDVGTISSNDEAWREWLPHSGITLFPWSSQGRGAFALPRPGDLRTYELADVWFSESNLARIVRAHEVARRRGVSPTSVALAWLLNQSFSVIPIVGPRSPAEVSDSFTALSVALSRDECDWLEHGRGTPPHS